jgi:pimeloyl-ACP methyl ester carboxylesterase
MRTTFKKRWLVITGIGIILALAWLATTDNVAVWPVRNTLQYRLLTWWWEWAGEPIPSNPGTLRGTVRDGQGNPIAGAWVLVSRWNGLAYSARSDADGHYLINNVPADTYRPVAGAPGYSDVRFGDFWGQAQIKAGEDTMANAVLPSESPPVVMPGRNLALGEPTTLSCTLPVEAAATRREVTFDNNGQPNQLTLFYTPITATTTSQFPILLTVYPGPADTWECASIPLAAADYAVLAVGPAYSFELERDIDELQRLVNFARAGKFPGGDGTKIALLGGSYSSLHVQRLLQRDQNFQAAVLLGPPTDLFDMRYRLEQGTYIPPFGLDQALIALGLPSQKPLRYWRYSGAYHVRPDLPPLAIIHSRTDEIVPFQQSELLATNLAAVGATYQVHFFDGVSHYLLDEEGEKIYRITLDFLAKHLQ